MLLLLVGSASQAVAWECSGEARDWTASVLGGRYGLVEWISTTSRTPTVVSTHFYAGRFLIALPGRIELWAGVGIVASLGLSALLISAGRRVLR